MSQDNTNNIDDTTILEIPHPSSPEWAANLPRPEWLRVRMRTDLGYGRVQSVVKQQNLHTVCREARCPNIDECWTSGTATFIIMGDICTRNCAYCAVKSGHPEPLDASEPSQVAAAVAAMQLKHAVVTSVDRDDLADYGSGHFAAVITAIHQACPDTSVEVLIPDFQGDARALERVLQAGPSVLNHNTETVPRLYPRLRSRGLYARCLEVLHRAHRYRLEQPGAGEMLVKSGLMLGLGESRQEVRQVLTDLRQCGVDVVTLGQYLRPSTKHVPVMRYWTPEELAAIGAEAKDMGFRWVESAPLVRSSYHAAAHKAAQRS